MAQNQNKHVEVGLSHHPTLDRPAALETKLNPNPAHLNHEGCGIDGKQKLHYYWEPLLHETELMDDHLHLMQIQNPKLQQPL